MGMIKRMKDMVNAAPGMVAQAQQPVSQFQAGQPRPGRTLLASIAPSNPAAVWLDFGSMR